MENEEREYVRRSQKDYSYAFKLQVVSEVESGQLTYTQARRKYGIQGSHTVKRWVEKFGNLDRAYQLRSMKKPTPEQELMALRQRIKLLEKQNKRLSKELEVKDQKVAFFDLMIDMAEEEFQVPIRKKSLGDVSKSTDTGADKA